MVKEEGGEQGWVDAIPRGAAEAACGFLLYLALGGSSWPAPLKAAVAVGAVVLLYGARAVWRRMQARRRATAESQSSTRPLTDVSRATGRIQPGWFVSFTGGPYSVASDHRDRHITAMGEVVEVLPEAVQVDWRDRRLVNLPSEVPLWLLDDQRARIFQDGGWVTGSNEGFRPTHGAAVTGRGWNAHDQSYAAWSRHRVKELTAEDRRRFEGEADLSNFRRISQRTT